jgi:Fe-S-cluster containining protein
VSKLSALVAVTLLSARLVPTDGALPTCRAGCGACCIAPSISTPIPGMPQGKPAGVRCVQLTPENRCRLYSHAERPLVCMALRPCQEMCGTDSTQAMAYLSALEAATQPAASLLKGTD